MTLAPDLRRTAPTLLGGPRTLAVAGVNHALHDGYTDLLYVLLPVWQAQFGLDYASLAILRTLYTAALAALQVPSTWLARSLGARAMLVLARGALGRGRPRRRGGGGGGPAPAG